MPRRYESYGLLTGNWSSVMDWPLEDDPFWLTLELFCHGQGFSLLSLALARSSGLIYWTGFHFRDNQRARNSIESRDNAPQNAIVESVINLRKAACRHPRLSPASSGTRRTCMQPRRRPRRGAAVVHLSGGPTCIEFVVACDAVVKSR